MKQTNGTKKLLSQVWRLTRSYWKSEEKKKAYALLVAILLLTLAVVAMLVLLNQWNNAFYTALQNYQTEEIFHQLKRFTVLAFLYIILAVYAYYLQQVLVLNWRRWLTNRYIDRWLQHQTYYRLEMFGKEMDNPDQRISEDVNLFVTKTLGFFVGIVKALCTLVSFVVILWQLSGPFSFALLGRTWHIPGYMVWVAVAYAALGTWLTHRVGHKLVALNFSQQRREADFRFSMMRMRENAESVAFYQGEGLEGRVFKKRFALLLSLLLCVLALPSACAAQGESELLAACLGQRYPDFMEAAYAEWGNTAAAVFVHNGQKILCLLENTNGQWQITVDNPNALDQTKELPSLLLDSDQSLYWSYAEYPETTYSSYRETGGVWAAPTEQVVSWAGKEYIVEDVFYQDGRIKHLWRLEDEEGNLIEQTVDPSFPAPWLADMTTLQAFDLSRFPVLGYTEYEGEWPDRTFLAQAAAALMPSRSWMRWAIPISTTSAASSAGPMKSKGTLRGISNVTESVFSRRWRGGRALFRWAKFSFACQKRTRKAPATFEAREARIKGCSPLIIPKELSKRKKASRCA